MPHPSVDTLGRACLRFGLIALVASTLTLPATATSAAPAIGVNTPAEVQTAEAEVEDEIYAKASLQAEESGVEVPVPGRTDEYSQEVARPDGMFSYTASPTPVRVSADDGSWHPVDTNLHRQPDGTYAPARVVTDLAFSGGGSDDPLVQMSHDTGASVGFRWPETLPEPTIEGDTATYSEVLPGVDLQLIAHANSYRQVLVVKDAQAAANPAIREITLETVTNGVDIVENPAGGLSAVDADGKPVFAGPAPYMWDSQTPASETDSSSDDTSVASVDPIDLAVTSDGTVELTPPPEALRGNDVVYPLYIDPALTGLSADTTVVHHTLTVHSGGWDYFDDASEPLRVGYCGWAGCTGSQGRSRSYFSFGLGPLLATAGRPHARIYAAQVTLNLEHSATNCGNPQPIDLYRVTADFYRDTNWAGPRGTRLDTDSKAGDGGCVNSKYLTYGGTVPDQSTTVEAYVRNTVIAGERRINFNVSAPDEDDKYQWKKLANPRLEVLYNTVPDVPTGLGIRESFTCPGSSVNRLNDAQPQLQATSTGNTSDQSVGTSFEILNSAGTTVLQRTTAPVVRVNGGLATWTPPSPLQDGTFSIRAKATTNASASENIPQLESAWTDNLSYVLDTVDPQSPVISSSHYPRDYWGARQGAPGKIILYGDIGTAAFTYAWDKAVPALPTNTHCVLQGSQAANSNGDAELAVPSTLKPGAHTLYVQAYDLAHNVSPQVSTYSFYVSPDIDTRPARREAETMSVPDTLLELHASAGAAAWTAPVTFASGQNYQHLLATATNVSDPASLKLPFNVDSSAYFALGANVRTGPSFGEIRFELNNQPIQVNGADTFDAYKSTEGTAYVQLGGGRLDQMTEGATSLATHTLTVEVVGKNPSAQSKSWPGTYTGTDGTTTTLTEADNGYSAGIDYLDVIPLGGVNYASLSQAIAADTLPANNAMAPLGTPANIGPNNTLEGFQYETLDAENFGSGDTRTVRADDGDASTTDDEVTFTMPVHGAQGNDNLIAAGQTIDLSAQLPATHVNLLASTSCGAWPKLRDNGTDQRNVTLKVNYFPESEGDDSAAPETVVPEVPSWLGTPPLATKIDGVVITPITFDHYTRAGARVTDNKTSLYLLRFPLNENHAALKLKSVELPTLGTNLTNDCKTPALHIFAISVN